MSRARSISDLPQERRELVRAAARARSHAYAPYSRFAVGAAVRTASGLIYTGCNVENAAMGPSVCAERVAIFKAVSEGETRLLELAVVTAVSATPCGPCRQVMAEFADDMPVLVADTAGCVQETTLSALLPMAFSRATLSSGAPAEQDEDSPQPSEATEPNKPLA